MRRAIRIFVGIVIIIVSLGVYFYPDAREWETQREVKQIMERFEEEFKTEQVKEASNHDVVNETTDNIESETVNADDSVKSYDTDSSEVQIKSFKELHQEMEAYNKRLVTEEQHIEDAWSYEQPPLTLKNMPNHDYTIGYIEIPDMKIKLPLLLGASMDNLSKGAAVLSETSMPIGGTDTNCVIAGHRGWKGSAYFQRIENLKQGSKVYVTNPWETMIYQVVKTKVVNPDDSDAILLQPGKDMVTLITCHPYVLGGGPYRYIVYCERVGTQNRETATNMKNPSIKKLEKETTENTESIVDEDSVQVPEEELKASNELLYWEECSRKYLPIGTIALSFLIIFIRGRKKKKH